VRKRYINDFCLYFQPKKPYTALEAEMKIKEQKDEIIRILEDKFKTHVAMTVKQYPIEQINVKEENLDFIITDFGIISKQAVIIEI